MQNSRWVRVAINNKQYQNKRKLTVNMGIICDWDGVIWINLWFIGQTRSVINNELLINQKGAQVKP